MSKTRFQFSLCMLHVVVAGAAIVLGAVMGGPVRLLIACASGLFAFVMLVCLGWLLCVFLIEGGATAWQWACWLARLPIAARRLLFERRMSRLRRGNPSERVRRLLGLPGRIDGFGDRLYWSYRVAGQRYTVSLDPRRLVAKYSNGISRDVSIERN